MPILEFNGELDAPVVKEFSGETDEEKAARGKRPGFFQEVGRQLVDVPFTHLPAAVAAAIEGSDTAPRGSITDKLIERSRKASAGYATEPGAKDPLLFGALDREDVRSLGPSLGFSGAGALAGLGAGLPAAAVTSPIGGYAAGGAASYKAASNMSASQFLRDVRDKLEKERGAVLSDSEWASIAPQYSEMADRYRTAEALPETLSNMAQMAILASPAGRFVPKSLVGAVNKNLATKGATKLAAMTAAELPSEVVTQQFQQPAQVHAGLQEGPERSLTSGADWLQSLKEVAGPIALQTAIMGGAGAAGVKGYRAITGADPKEQPKPELNPRDKLLNDTAEAVIRKQNAETKLTTEATNDRQNQRTAAGKAPAKAAPAAEETDAASQAVLTGAIDGSALPITQEQEARNPLAPATVAGVPADTHTDEQLQALAASPETPANTRHAAAVAMEARLKNAAPIEGGFNRVVGDAKILGDAVVSKPFIEHGFRGLDVPTQRRVMYGMLGVTEDRKVLNAIIPLIPVDVMNALTRRKITPEMLFHDKAVLEQVFLGNGVSGPDISGASIDALIRGAASVSAELNGVKPGVIVAPRNALPTVSASANNSGALGAGGTLESGLPDVLPRTKANSVAELPVGRNPVSWAQQNISTKGTIDNRHGVTPNSDAVTGEGGADTSPLPTILPQKTPPLETKTPPDLLQKSGTTPVAAQKSEPDSSGTTITATKQNLGTSQQVSAVQKSPELSIPVEQKQGTVNLPKTGTIEPKIGIPTERPAGKILGADVRALSDAHIAKFAKSKNKKVSDLATADQAWRAANVPRGTPAESPKPAAPVAEAAKPEAAQNYEQAWNAGVADAEKEHKGNRGAAVLWGYGKVFDAASKAAGLDERYAPHGVEQFANVESKSPAPETYQQALATFDEYLGKRAEQVAKRSRDEVQRYEPQTGNESSYRHAARTFLKEADGIEGGYKKTLAVAGQLLPASENVKKLADAVSAKQDEFRGIAASYDAMADGVIADAKAREDARTRPFNPVVGRLQKKDLGLAKSTASWLRAKLGKTPWYTDGHVAVDKAPVKNIEEFYGTRDKGDNPKDWAPIDPIVKRMTGTRVEATPIAEEHAAEGTTGLVSVIFDADGSVVAINRIYYDLLKTMYPQSKFVVRKGYDSNGALEVVVGDKLVAIIMPLRLAQDRLVEDIRALLAPRAEPAPAEPTPEPPISASAEKPMTVAGHLEAAAKLMREAEKGNTRPPVNSGVKPGMPSGGTQERVGEPVTGRPEPVQTKGEGAGEKNITTKDFDRAIAIGIAAGEREQFNLRKQEVSAQAESIRNNGNIDTADMRRNPEYWDAEAEDMTDAGRSEYQRREDAQAAAQAENEYPVITELSDLDRAHQFAQRDAMEAILDSLGIDYQTPRTWSTSRYIEVTLPSGETAKMRFANHANQVRDTSMTADINIAPGEYTFTESIDWLQKHFAQPNPQATPATPEPAPRQEGGVPGSITDFGEKIGGARKDYAETYRDRMKEAASMDIAAEPLSKSWPEPDYQKLLDEKADPWSVAFAHASRDEVPTKPQKSWRLDSWVQQVRLLRDVTDKIMAGEISARDARHMLSDAKGLTAVSDRAELYTIVGHDKSLKGVRISSGTYGIFNREKFDPPKVIWSVERKTKTTAMSRWPEMLAHGVTREEAIANFKKAWSATPAEQEAKAIEFDIYSRRGTSQFFIGKKIGKNVVTLKDGFTTAKEARAWKAANQAELVKALEKIKEVPNDRRENNSPRVGEDHRNGADVTPAQFSETFGFRGVEFGNYVEESRRQSDLNEAYDALMDLAGVLGVPTKALSLNGELALAFGARGMGGRSAGGRAPAAHYEPGKVVINLTKERGAGSLAHEWFHAVDNYFSRARGDKAGFVTGAPGARGEGMRPEMLAAFNRVMAAVRASGVKERSVKLDSARYNPYWGLSHEMAARSFESYVIAKLHDQSASNDYLANIVSKEYWDAAAALGMEKEGTYPYPADADMPAIRAAFDDFFKTVETRETDKGVEMYSQTDEPGPGLPAADIRAHLSAITAKLSVAVPVYDSVEQARLAGFSIASDAQGFAKGDRLGLISGRIKTLFDAETTLFHELWHVGIKRVTSDPDTVKAFANYNAALNRVAMANPEVRRRAKVWRDKYGADKRAQFEAVGVTGPELELRIRLQSFDEAIAEMAGDRRGKPVTRLNELIAALQRLVRALGFDELASWMESKTDAEVLALIRAATQAITNEKRPEWQRSTGVQFPSKMPARGAGKIVLSEKEFVKGDFVAVWGEDPFTAPQAETPIQLGDVFQTAYGETLTVLRQLPGGRLEVRIQDKRRSRTVEYTNKQVKEGGLGMLGRADLVDGSYVTPEALIRMAADEDPESYARLDQTQTAGLGDPDIMLARAGGPFNAIQQSRGVANAVAGLFKSPSALGPVNFFNTPFHKAEMLERKGIPGYKRVFQRLQLYLNDISGFAVQAEQLMPSIMRELKGIMPKDFRAYFKGAASEADIAAIGPWLNHGTLYGGGSPLEGVVWTDDELRGNATLARPIPRELKPLTETQRPLYRQARKGIAQSLETSGKAVIYRHVAKYGITFDRGDSLAAVASDVIEQLDTRIEGLTGRLDKAKENAGVKFMNTERLADEIKNHRGTPAELHDLRVQWEQAKKDDAAGSQEAQNLQAEMDILQALTDKSGTIQQIANHAKALIDHGYMPLKRFGNKTVTAFDADGNTKFFGAYDGTPLAPGSANREMLRVAAEVRALHPEWRVVTGTRSEKAWKMYQGLSMDALENFLDFLDPETKAELERDKTIQEYLKNAVNDHSVLKQLIHRKGTPGFSTDVPRILASFVTSHARNASGLYHLAEAKRLVGEIPDQYGTVKDEAAELVDYVTRPGEEAAVLRSFLFFNFLGGSVAAAAINLTQTVMTTAPYLSQYTGVGKLTAAIGRAGKLAVGDPAVMAGELGKDLQRAELEGITAPQQIYHLAAMASNNPFSSDRRFRTAMAVWNGMFGAAEVFNRRIAFIAAHDIATERGMGTINEQLRKFAESRGEEAKHFDNAYDFAADAVDQTQFIYNKANRMNAARGPIGATVMTFKTFSVSWLELLRRLPPKQQLVMLGVLMLMAGAEGLPFEEDIADAVDTLGQWLGFTTNTGKWTGKIIRETLGSEFERPILKGLGGMLPIDLHSRLGLPNLIPGTAFAKPSEIDKTRDVAEAFGPVGGIMRNLMDGLQLMARGKWDRAALQAAPKAARDFYNGAYMMTTGESQDTKGRLAMTDMTAAEGLGKLIGFNPQRAAREGEARREEMLDKNLRTVRMDEIASDWADGVLRKDQDKQRAARDRLREWNLDNPELRIDGQQILRSVRERVKTARMTSQQRFLKSLPKTMRPEAREVFR